jgi:ABC-type sugar transport system ATPase subunit
MSAIVVEDLVKRYDGFTAVEDVSFTAAAGEVTALLGPNGAGKTTTIEILEGFQAPTVADGELTLPSADVTADLALLTGWARDNHVDLTGLEIGSPSLEDAYLALTSEEGAENRG